MIKRLLFVQTLCLLAAGKIMAQQDPVYSQYMFNMMGINPAYAGSRDILTMTGIYRRQWAHVDGSPATQLFSADCAVRQKKIGLGLQVFNDAIGIIKNSGIYTSYAYRIRLNEGVLALGLQAGLVKFTANYASLMLSGDQYDNVLSQNANELRPNFGAGLYYSSDKFYIGFSAPHLFGQEKVTTTADKKIFEQNNHWFMATGFVIPLSMDVKLKPSALLSMVNGAPVNVDLNANVWFVDVLSIGLSYRTSKSVTGMIELQASRQIRIGYAYDWTVSSFGNQGGTNEIMLRYEFGYGKKNIYSPRYF